MIKRRRFAWLAALPFMAAAALAQNVVEDAFQETFERRALADAEAALIEAALPQVVSAAESPAHLRSLLEKHVSETVEGWPWQPFFHQLGISGAEIHFDHPDELFHTLSLALPYLGPQSADRVRRFLSTRLEEAPPYAIEGFSRAAGQARERYTVPETLRPASRGKARDAWGVYAFLEYLAASPNEALVQQHWPAIRQRMQSLLEKEYPFDATKNDYTKDETQRLNGDLAGCYASVHLARLAGDHATAELAGTRTRALLQLRLDVERLNPRLLERTDVATKTLHHFKLARYLHLPEPAVQMLRNDGTAAQRLREFRATRPGWWMAFGDRLIGGENYTVSPDFGRALFLGATRLENLPPTEAVSWLDVPWCKADLYFIERLALVLSTAAQ